MSSETDGQSEHQRPPSAWVARVFAELESPLLAYARRRLGEEQAARDVVQEAFVKLCQQSWPDIEPQVTAWLYTTCRNKTIDLTRREGRMSAIQSKRDVAQVHDRSGSPPDELASQSEQIIRMRSEIEQLPERQQELLRLRLQEGLSYKQIAQVTGLTVTNVGYLLHQAVSSLRASLQV